MGTDEFEVVCAAWGLSQVQLKASSASVGSGGSRGTTTLDIAEGRKGGQYSSVRLGEGGPFTRTYDVADTGRAHAALARVRMALGHAVWTLQGLEEALCSCIALHGLHRDTTAETLRVATTRWRGRNLRALTR